MIALWITKWPFSTKQLLAGRKALNNHWRCGGGGEEMKDRGVLKQLGFLEYLEMRKPADKVWVPFLYCSYELTGLWGLAAKVNSTLFHLSRYYGQLLSVSAWFYGGELFWQCSHGEVVQICFSFSVFILILDPVPSSDSYVSYNFLPFSLSVVLKLYGISTTITKQQEIIFFSLLKI